MASPWPGLGDLTVQCDPYLTWAVASQWRGEARKVQSRFFQTDERRIRVLLCAESADALKAVADLEGIAIPQVYLQDVPGAKVGDRSRFATATLHPSLLRTLLDKKHRVQFELAAPVRDQGGPLKGDAKGYFGQQTDVDIAAARAQVSSWLRARQKADKKPEGPPVPASPPPGTIAVFDYGCPFLREQFMHADEPSSRIESLWHQENLKAESPWEQSPIGPGRTLHVDQLNRLITLSRSVHQVADEGRIYSGMNYLIEYAHPRRQVFTSTHGAHVLHMAGGHPNPLRPQEDRDAAGKARLVFVQMPEDTAGDSSASSLGACLLDALRFALAASPTDKPLVFNVSFGTTAGPHDGSSLIEQAMDELLSLRPHHFAVVLAAGNSRHLGLHCQRALSAKHTSLFRIDVKPEDRTDTFVEFWYRRGVDLQFRARLPSGDWSDWVDADSSVDLLSDSGDDIVASLIHRRTVPNGKRSMVLLALRPTETPADDDGPLSPPGQWEVEARWHPRVKAGSASKVAIDAWIKRDDSRPYSGRVQSTFVGVDRSDSENTLNGLATGLHTIVASGFRWSNGMTVEYASKGPRRPGQLPIIYGLCEWDSIDAGIRASAVRSGETQLMNGTSVAAPVVARQVFKLLVGAGSKGLSKSQLLVELKKLAAERGSPLRTD